VKKNVYSIKSEKKCKCFPQGTSREILVLPRQSLVGRLINTRWR